MPIDLCSSVNKISNYTFGSGFLNTIFGSSLSVAFVVSIIMILLIMMMYPAKSGTSLLIIVKLFIYMFMFTLLIVFLHDGVLKYAMKENVESETDSSFIKNTATMGGDVVYHNYNNINPAAGAYSKPTTINDDIETTEKMLSTPAVVVKNKQPASTTYEGSIIGGAVKQTLTGSHPPKTNINPFDR